MSMPPVSSRPSSPASASFRSSSFNDSVSFKSESKVEPKLFPNPGTPEQTGSVYTNTDNDVVPSVEDLVVYRAEMEKAFSESKLIEILSSSIFGSLDVAGSPLIPGRSLPLTPKSGDATAVRQGDMQIPEDAAADLRLILDSDSINSNIAPPGNWYNPAVDIGVGQGTVEPTAYAKVLRSESAAQGPSDVAKNQHTNSVRTAKRNYFSEQCSIGLAELKLYFKPTNVMPKQTVGTSEENLTRGKEFENSCRRINALLLDNFEPDIGKYNLRKIYITAQNLAFVMNMSYNYIESPAIEAVDPTIGTAAKDAIESFKELLKKQIENPGLIVKLADEFIVELDNIVRQSIDMTMKLDVKDRSIPPLLLKAATDYIVAKTQFERGGLDLHQAAKKFRDALTEFRKQLKYNQIGTYCPTHLKSQHMKDQFNIYGVLAHELKLKSERDNVQIAKARSLLHPDSTTNTNEV